VASRESQGRSRGHYSIHRKTSYQQVAGVGKYVIKERIEIAKTKGAGWQDYIFINPISNKVESKTACFEKYGDIIVGCGAYKPEK
jgi:hypothetical protein